MILAASAVAWGYPLDGAAKTGIRRLIGYRLSNEGKIARTVTLPPGALLSSDRIRLHLIGLDYDITGVTTKDATLQAGLQRIFAGRDPSYSIALLDISNPAHPRYAALRGDSKMIPGSVGKLLVATGFFDALRLRFPSDIRARETFLRQTVIAADNFVYADAKTVPVYHEGDPRVVSRRVEVGDQYSLWEWLDHMLSQSSNASGSTVWKEAIFFRRFPDRYPLPLTDESAFLQQTPKPVLSRLALETLEAPLLAAGLDTHRLRLGTFFTRNASAMIPGTPSYAAPNELLRWLVRLEQGRVVDEWSSLEIKKLLYFTRPRYRYASSPALRNAAVYFKSGSLYHCAPGEPCSQYKGTTTNLMHSVAIVESRGKTYLVAMMSNVLRLNSAVEHQTIAGEIEKLIQSR